MIFQCFSVLITLSSHPPRNRWDDRGIPFSFTVLIKVWRKYGHPTLNYSFIILLTALEIEHGETPRWHDGFANRLECTKKTHIAPKYAPPALFTSPCQKYPSSLCPCHETPQHPKIHTKLAAYGQQKSALPGLADG